MVTHIDAGFDSNNKMVFGTADFIRVFKKII
jgi:hypothetical protein